MIKVIEWSGTIVFADIDMSTKTYDLACLSCVKNDLVDRFECEYEFILSFILETQTF